MEDEVWHRDFVRWAQSERTRQDRLWPADELLPADNVSLAELKRRSVGAGLAWVRGEWFQPATPEVTASLTAHTASLDELPARSRAVFDRLPFLMMGRRALARGAPLDALLAAVQNGPSEERLQHARLLRIELAVLSELTVSVAKSLADELLELWAQHRAAPIQSRCVESLLRLSRLPDVAVRVFSEAVARAIARSHRAAALRAAPGEIDDALSALLAGRPANDVQLAEADHSAASARRHAWLAGALAGQQHPLWWNDAWHALERESGELARAFLGGTALTIGDARLAGALVGSVDDARPEVRVAGWAALAAAQSPEAHELLATIGREPSAECRAQVAGSTRLGEVALLRALGDDPDPGVRGAALFNLASLDALRSDQVQSLRADARTASLNLRRSGARALALAGLAELSHGVTLAEAAVDEASSPGVGLGAARALAVWAGPETHWRELYARAAGDRRWLHALGEALSEDWPGLFPAPPSEREKLRVQALQWIGDEDTQLAAAHILRVHPDPADSILDVFSTSDLPTSELTVLTLVATTAHGPRPQLVKPLWDWIDDESAETAARQAAMSTLGCLAPGDAATLERIALQLDGPLVNEAYHALAQVAGRMSV